MTRDPKVVSARGVYYDLSKSPYIYKYEDLVLRFSSKKKLEMFKKQFAIGKINIEDFCATYGLITWKNKAIRQLAEQVYNKVMKVV